MKVESGWWLVLASTIPLDVGFLKGSRSKIPVLAYRGPLWIVKSNHCTLRLLDSTVSVRRGSMLYSRAMLAVCSSSVQ